MQGAAGSSVPCPSAAGMRLGIIVARFNADVTDALLRGALSLVADAGGTSDVETFTVPGAFELPQAARAAALTGRFDALICLGCVIRGGTPHFEYVSSGTAHGIMQVATTMNVPIAFGVLTTNTHAEAAERATDGPGNKGREAAQAAIEMVHVLRAIAAGPATVRV